MFQTLTVAAILVDFLSASNNKLIAKASRRSGSFQQHRSATSAIDYSNGSAAVITAT